MRLFGAIALAIVLFPLAAAADNDHPAMKVDPAPPTQSSADQSIEAAAISIVAGAPSRTTPDVLGVGWQRSEILPVLEGKIRVTIFYDPIAFSRVAAKYSVFQAFVSLNTQSGRDLRRLAASIIQELARRHFYNDEIIGDFNSKGLDIELCAMLPPPEDNGDPLVLAYYGNPGGGLNMSPPRGICPF